jgi:hypothetical protein
MGRYSAYLGEAFRERLSVLEKHAIGALSLREELVLMHELCGRAAAQYEAASKHAATIENSEQRMRLMHFATQYLVEALNQVRDMTVAAKRVEDDNRMVDVATVHALVTHTCEIIDAKLRNDGHGLALLRPGVTPDDFVMDLAQDIRTKLLTVDAVAKTQLTPERLNKEVTRMLDSVPEVA